jgi:hypothetical protein
MESALAARNQCSPGGAEPKTGDVRDVAANVRLARELWGERLKLCGQPGTGEEALSRAIALVSR